MDPLPDDLAKPRAQSDYKNLSRSQALNHLETEKTKSRPGHKIIDFITRRFWSWIYYYLKSRFRPDYPYPAYPAGNTGIYRLPPGAQEDMVTIALVADWATNTRESIHIAEAMAGHGPAYTIHLGDTYFVGAPHEIAANFVMPGSPWVKGTAGSFALLGNHEMYAQGSSFFIDLLPTLGIRDQSTGVCSGQHAGYFCLENDHWRILGLDTGYHSTGKLPVVELIFPPDCHFDEKLMSWLRDTVKLGDGEDKRGLVILTHHQYITAFKTEKEYTQPARQLAELIGTERPVLWIWGHEHKFSAFSKLQVGQGITAYGRCIGHGGMPVERAGRSFRRSPGTRGFAGLVFVDDRVRHGTGKDSLGHNGYAVIRIKNEELKLSYYDEHHLLLEESWRTDPQTGIRGTGVFPSPDFRVTPESTKTWNDLIK